MNKKLKTFLGLSLIAALLLVWSPLQAQEKSSLLLMPSKSKTIYLLYLKMTGQRLNADAAIRQTEIFRKATGEEQNRMIASEKIPLETEFTNIDPKKQVIVIRSSVNLKTSLAPNSRLQASFTTPPRPASSIYFPYNWGGLNIALIPDRLEPFLDIPLKPSEATSAISKITGGTATIVIEMLPLSADARSQMTLDGVPQWLLMTRIVAVSYYNETMQTIWHWKSPDYRRAGDASPLQDLKK